jgi:tetratricopeptide (TPR) repeat protein
LEEVGMTLALLRRWEEAEATFDTGMALHPQHNVFYRNKAWVRLARFGVLDSVWPIMDDARTLANLDNQFFTYDWWLATLDRDYDRAEAGLAEFRGDAPSVRRDRLLRRGLVRHFRGDATVARQLLDSARVLFEQELSGDVFDADLYQAIAWAHAVRGDRDEAIAAARQATEWLPIERDAYYGPRITKALAVTYALLGDANAAVPLLDSLLGMPGDLGVFELRLDPLYDAIRADPGFLRLLDREN